MEHNGYVAAVEFDDASGRLHGRVVNSGAYPIATFEATDMDGLRREFRWSIDEYLASCREDGVEPNMPLGHARPRPSAARRAPGHRARREPNSWDQGQGRGRDDGPDRTER